MSNITGPSGEPLRRFVARIAGEPVEIFAENKRDARIRAEKLAATAGTVVQMLHEVSG